VWSIEYGAKWLKGVWDEGGGKAGKGKWGGIEDRVEDCVEG
jgi:hypothetical protein